MGIEELGAAMNSGNVEGVEGDVDFTDVFD